MKEPEIVSIVGGGAIGRELNLEALSNDIEGEIVSYDPNNWHGLRLRFKHTDPSVLVFRSGKYNVAGAASTHELYQVKDDFLNELSDIGIDTSKSSFDIYNYVFKSDFEREIDLEKISIVLGLDYIEYEPEQFPGLLYRPPDSNATFLIFNSGKIILTGIRDTKGVEERFIELDNKLMP